jgi:hypothetical protein
VGLQRLLQTVLDLRKKHSSTYQRVWFDTPLLRQPHWQSLQILPASYVNRLEDVLAWMEANLETPELPFRGFKDYEIQRIRRDIAWMKEGAKMNKVEMVQHRADFYRFFNEYDKRHKFSFVDTFPEMIEFWNECRYHAQK